MEKSKSAVRRFSSVRGIAEDCWKCFAVTARHCIEQIVDRASDPRKMLIRVNTKSGGATCLEMDVSEWEFHNDNRVDVAVARAPDLSTLDHLPFPVDGFYDGKQLGAYPVGVGHDLFFPGLFTNRKGEQKNIPIIRIGNIAAVPEEPVRTRLGWTDAYLIEARSIGGLSGSPVFACQEYNREWLAREFSMPYATHGFALLGLIQGHFNAPDSGFSHDFRSSFAERIDSGIAIVVPVQKITEVLRIPRFSDILKREAEACAVRKGRPADPRKPLP